MPVEVAGGVTGFTAASQDIAPPKPKVGGFNEAAATAIGEPVENLLDQINADQFTTVSEHGGSLKEAVQKFKDSPHDATLPRCLRNLGFTSFEQVVDRMSGTDDPLQREPTIRELRAAKKEAEAAAKTSTETEVRKTVSDETPVIKTVTDLQPKPPKKSVEHTTSIKVTERRLHSRDMSAILYRLIEKPSKTKFTIGVEPMEQKPKPAPAQPKKLVLPQKETKDNKIPLEVRRIFPIASKKAIEITAQKLLSPILQRLTSTTSLDTAPLVKLTKLIPLPPTEDPKDSIMEVITTVEVQSTEDIPPASAITDQSAAGVTDFRVKPTAGPREYTVADLETDEYDPALELTLIDFNLIPDESEWADPLLDVADIWDELGITTGFEADDATVRAIQNPSAAAEMKPDSDEHAETPPITWSDELDFAPLQVYEDFTEALQSLVAVPAAGEPILDIGIQQNLELTATVDHEAQTVPPIAALITEQLSKLETEQKESVAPILKNIARAIQAIRMLDAEEAVHPEARQADLKEQIRALFEQLGTEYQAADIERFIAVLLRPGFQSPLPVVTEFVNVDLEHDGTHEAKIHFSHLISSLADVEDKAQQILGRLVLFYAARHQMVGV